MQLPEGWTSGLEPEVVMQVLIGAQMPDPLPGDEDEFYRFMRLGGGLPARTDRLDLTQYLLWRDHPHSVWWSYLRYAIAVLESEDAAT